jgi:hypothetical protein
MVEEVAQPRVSLKLRAGEREGPFFQDVLVYDLSCTLGDFLDSALKDLESRSLIQLPEREESDLIDPRTFKVLNEEMTQELDLSLPLCDHPYIVSGLAKGATSSVLVLQSDIFMTASQVVVEQLVKLRQTNSQEPEVPRRGSSLEAKVMSREEVVYLAGRRDPAFRRWAARAARWTAQLSAEPLCGECTFHAGVSSSLCVDIAHRSRGQSES